MDTTAEGERPAGSGAMEQDVAAAGPSSSSSTAGAGGSSTQGGPHAAKPTVILVIGRCCTLLFGLVRASFAQVKGYEGQLDGGTAKHVGAGRGGGWWHVMGDTTIGTACGRARTRVSTTGVHTSTCGVAGSGGATRTSVPTARCGLLERAPVTVFMTRCLLGVPQRRRWNRQSSLPPLWFHCALSQAVRLCLSLLTRPAAPAYLPLGCTWGAVPPATEVLEASTSRLHACWARLGARCH